MSVRAPREELNKLAGSIAGVLLFAASVKIFISPVHLYNGGIVGMGQIVQSVLTESFGLSFPFDFTGVVAFLINIPLMLLAYRSMGKGFLLRTILCVVCQSTFLSAIPAPAEPIISDALTACLIGGIISGFGVGLTLKSGGSGGGLDVLGVYFTKKNQNFSVGRMTVLVNVFVYGVCAILFDLETVIYSLIFTGIQSIFIDRIHVQNIAVEVLIFTKQEDGAIQRDIIRDMGRGVTYWQGFGGYTEDQGRILCVVISKFEIAQLKRIIAQHDPLAFVMIKEGLQVSNNFVKRL